MMTDTRASVHRSDHLYGSALLCSLSFYSTSAAALTLFDLYRWCSFPSDVNAVLVFVLFQDSSAFVQSVSYIKHVLAAIMFMVRRGLVMYDFIALVALLWVVQPVQSERLWLQVLAFLTVEMLVLRGNIYFLNLIYFCHFNEPHSSTSEWEN